MILRDYLELNFIVLFFDLKEEFFLICIKELICIESDEMLKLLLYGYFLNGVDFNLFFLKIREIIYKIIFDGRNLEFIGNIIYF